MSDPPRIGSENRPVDLNKIWIGIKIVEPGNGDFQSAISAIDEYITSQQNARPQEPVSIDIDDPAHVPGWAFGPVPHHSDKPDDEPCNRWKHHHRQDFIEPRGRKVTGERSLPDQDSQRKVRRRYRRKYRNAFPAHRGSIGERLGEHKREWDLWRASPPVTR